VAETKLKQGDAIAKSQEFVSQLAKLKNHPGFNDLFGFTWQPGKRHAGGSNAADADTIFNKLEGMGFGEAIKSMRGMGSLSDAEGKKVSAAFLGMEIKMSEKAAKARINEITETINKGLERVKTGKLVNPDGTPKATQPTAPPADPYTEAGNSLLNNLNR